MDPYIFKMFAITSLHNFLSFFAQSIFPCTISLTYVTKL